MTQYVGRRWLQTRRRGALTNLSIVSECVAKQIFWLLSRSWVNVLLLCVPVGITLHALSGPLIAVLVVNFLAAVGLHSVGGAILRSITLRIGRRYGMLLYISASNLMQAISSIVLLLRGQIILMQLTLIGNLLVNILLLPALSIFYATYQGKNMVHDHEVTKKYTLLLFLATSGFVAPTVFNRETTLPDASTAGLSRATSILLILTYAAYLVFQLWTHKNFFEGYLPGMHHPSTPISSSPELMIAELQTNSTPQRQENGE